MLEQLGLAEGSKVDAKAEAGRIRTTRPKRLTMNELLEGFTPDDQLGELDWGGPAGREVW